MDYRVADRPNGLFTPSRLSYIPYPAYRTTHIILRYTIFIASYKFILYYIILNSIILYYNTPRYIIRYYCVLV